MLFVVQVKKDYYAENKEDTRNTAVSSFFIFFFATFSKKFNKPLANSYPKKH